MKKFLMISVLLVSIGLLAGCQSNKSGGFDNADSATFDQTNTSPTDDSGNPPVPPEPTQAQ